jgi:dihydroorotase
MKQLIINAKIVNEGKVLEADVLLEGERIKEVGPNLQHKPSDQVIDALGQYLLPGVIDDQVHFREPGLVHKATIGTESKAAVAGGVTSFMEMPNTVPPVFSQQLLEEKFNIAARDSFANYSFYMGTSNDNFDEVMRTDLNRVCGLKIFMGSSTGNLLVDNPNTLEKIFANFTGLIATHCEDERTILANLKSAREQYGDQPAINIHPKVRSADACYTSSRLAVGLAQKHGTRLHVLHISTEKEVSLFEATTDLANKKITAEACVHHLWFTDADYDTLGTRIKWNPAIKTASDRDGIWKGLSDNRIDVIATDHAPHTKEEKGKSYFDAPSGGPLIEHTLLATLEMSKQGRISLTRLVEKMCHNPAALFRIIDRGFIREGYFADLVLVNPNRTHKVEASNIIAKCGWSPFENTTFSHSISGTWVNGHMAYWQGKFKPNSGKRLEFRPF